MRVEKGVKKKETSMKRKEGFFSLGHYLFIYLCEFRSTQSQNFLFFLEHPPFFCYLFSVLFFILNMLLFYCFYISYSIFFIFIFFFLYFHYYFNIIFFKFLEFNKNYVLSSIYWPLSSYCIIF